MALGWISAIPGQKELSFPGKASFGSRLVQGFPGSSLPTLFSSFTFSMISLFYHQTNPSQVNLVLSRRRRQSLCDSGSSPDFYFIPPQRIIWNSTPASHPGAPSLGGPWVLHEPQINSVGAGKQEGQSSSHLWAAKPQPGSVQGRWDGLGVTWGSGRCPRAGTGWE